MINKHLIIKIGFVLSLTFILMSIITPASATCVVKIIGGADVLASTNTGSSLDDLILCDPGNELSAILSALQGDDTILVYADNGFSHPVAGDAATDSGDDDITIFEDAEVAYIAGDQDYDGGQGGNDHITVYGVSATIYGDFILDHSNGGTDTGGDDVIEVLGSSEQIWGDRINPTTNIHIAGDDIIIVHPGATTGGILGDVLYSTSALSKGGDDKISVFGTVAGNILGDEMQAGQAGRDDIVVGDGGIVNGTIYGDYVNLDSGLNNNDRIVVLGTVKGGIQGDGYRGNPGRDYITVDSFATVEGDITGEGLFKEVGNANGEADHIVIKGKVGGDILGDGVDGNGGNDAITISARSASSNAFGYVSGAVIGDTAGGKGGRDQIYTTRFSWVMGGVFGDNKTRSGGNGGNDNIQIDGRVGTANALAGVYGDKAYGNGGDDFIHIGKYATINGPVVGDDVNGTGGEDLIWIDGTVTQKVIGDSAGGGNVKDQIAVRQGGSVGRSVVGDGTSNSQNGGWDTINIIGGTVDQHIYGDDVGGNGGNDFMAIRMNGVVGLDFVGDKAGKIGGNDTMSLINGTVNRDMIGDDSGGNGGDDKMNVLVAGTVKGDLIGDKTANDKVGGDDSIFVAGKVDGRIYGDHATKNAFAGKDIIQTSPSAVIGNGVWGDNAKGAGKNDTFKINGKINAGGVRGDVVNGRGGNDNISVFSLGDVKGNVVGDDANGAGGNDTILVDNNGKVTGHVWGDFSKGNGGNDSITIVGTVTGNVEGDHHKSGSTANGGDDTILIDNGAVVHGSVFGDNSPGNGGDDKIDIKGKVNGNVLGDNVGGVGGNDVIRIFPAGVVGGNVCGKNNCTTNPGDNIVFLDENANPALDYADTIIIAGTVLGNVIAGTTYGNSDDTIVVVEGAEIGGTVYAGDETNGDTFVYVENIINEEKTISEVVNSVTEKDGQVFVNGVTYTLDDVENVAGAVGQIACFGMDYRMNKVSDGCAARSQSEKDAIQWHLDNPGNDGRLPGLEGCAVYPYGDGLRVYAIIDGDTGELVAEVWGDVFSNAPMNNELLGTTGDGNVKLYHLASGELQIECHNFVDGKTQVRVLSDLTGTITNAYDKG